MNTIRDLAQQILLDAILLTGVPTLQADEPAIDLTRAVVVTPATLTPTETNAVRMLVEEIQRRSQISMPVRTAWPMDDTPVITVGSASALKSFPRADTSRVSGAGGPDGYRIWSEGSGNGAPSVWIAGNDSRGVLYGVSCLLRKLELSRQRIVLEAPLDIATAPQSRLRGHQLGYRPKTNSYDAWTVPMWEQYIRDLAVFGCNAIELIPPRSDDAADSPHFPLSQIEMMIEMSRLADAYGMDVWIWYPALDKDYSDPQTVQFAVGEWGAVFQKLPRVDAVFVPGGDPGHTQPKHLFRLLEIQAANLRRYHPNAGMWVSPQSFNKPWTDEFLELLAAEPPWLAGVVYGPQVRMPLVQLRAAIPSRYPIRDYPDITHSRHCQYPVPDWDLAFALTEGREVINPRPTQMANIFRVSSQPYTIGFITYSEGCNDDVNKAIWSALGWNHDVDVIEVLRDYSRYFIGASRAAEFADGLAALEKNWQGAVCTNDGINATWRNFQAMEQNATPQQKTNWRFQQALYRSAYDAFVRRRLLYETALEEQSLANLKDAERSGSIAAMQQAEEILDRTGTQPVAVELRGRLFELAEALFQSIRMQLSVPRYQGMPGRGNNLDDIDQPLNNRLWLKHRFAEIRQMGSEEQRRRALDDIVNWTNPGPDGFYDDLGNPSRQPHLNRGAGWEKDPGFFATPQVGFTDRTFRGAPVPISWYTSAESLYDATLTLHYTKLDPIARYKLRVVYGHYRKSPKVRLVANDSIEVHPSLERACEPMEFDLPSSATARGELTLTFFPEPGLGGNGRVLQVAEVWLMKQANF